MQKYVFFAKKRSADASAAVSGGCGVAEK